MKIVQLQEWNGWLIGLSDSGELFRYRYQIGRGPHDSHPDYGCVLEGWEPIPSQILAEATP